VAGELGNLGLVYMSLGELDRAEVAYQQAIAALKELKVMGQYLNALGTLGAVYLLSGKLDKALGCLNEQLLLAKSLDYARETARALSNRGAALMYQGRYAESLDDIAACQHLFIEQNRRAMYIASLVDLGYCCVGLGELARARQAVNDALQQAEELSLPTLRLIALRCLAVIEPDQSMERLQEALSLARELERRLDEAGCLLSLAGLSADETERLRLWNEGALLLQQCGASAWLIGRAPDNPPVVALTL
jgi:tetratricopeptide (TPR) repeat protein